MDALAVDHVDGVVRRVRDEHSPRGSMDVAMIEATGRVWR